MKSKLLSSILFLVFGTAAAFADGTAEFNQANQRFKSGDFAGAAAGYEKVIASDGPRASVYYNLGNAYQNLKQYGPAVLAYERARLLAPRDADLQANLTQARKAAAAFEETGPHPALDAALGFLSRNEWSWLVAGSALFIGVLAVACGAERPGNRRIRKAAIIATCAAILLIAVGGTALYLRRDESNRGVVLTDNAAVHLSPFEKAESLGTPGPGRIVRMGARSGAFHYIEVPGTNLRGWLSDKEVQPIAVETATTK